MDCPSYNSEPLESITHTFWLCSIACKVWETAFTFLFRLKTPMPMTRPQRTLKLVQCLFNKILSSRIKARRFNIVWSLLRGVRLLAIWLKWNDLLFQNERWHNAKLRNIMWQWLLDYGRIEWIG